MCKIINYGSINIDHVYEVSHIVVPGETISSRKYTVYYGGKGLNQSIALAKSGVKVKHIGQVGTDGSFIKEKLKQAGVDTECIFIGQEPTGHAVIQVAMDGENSIVLYPGANRTITSEQIDSAFEDAGAGDILLLQNETNNNALAIEKAFSKGMTICMNPAPFDESIVNLPLEKVNIIILNELEGKALSGKNDENVAIETLSKKYPEMTIVMTLGSRGVVCRKNEIQICLPARKVDVVDTTAAGDTFTGYFLGTLSQGFSLETSLRLGVLAASISISRNGAADSIPEKNEVNKLNEL